MKRDTKLYLERRFRAARPDVSFDRLVETALPFFERVNSPISLGVWLRLKYCEYSQYLDMDLRPDWYNSPDDFFFDYQCVKLFSKSEIFPAVYNTQEEAISSFLRAEEGCFITNERFRLREDPLFRDPAISSISHAAMRKISHILGRCPDVNELPLLFGPGNNVHLSNNTSIVDKLKSVITVTPNLYPYVSQIMETCPAWTHLQSSTDMVPTTPASCFLQVRQVVGSKLGFVPKTAKTDRSICTEPLLNSVVQLGIGRVLRSRLKRAGCNLDSQVRNQDLARLGSISNGLCTVDLKAASDTIASAIVLELLPEPWFSLLYTARSPFYTVGEKAYEFNKFSSMGNGFTFELETLIFLALARATCEHLSVPMANVSVYGDDIIIPVEAVTLFRRVLLFFGFEVNESKSFSDGPFRESCGKDWFLGVLVRPLFCKRAPTNEVLISWCNSLFRLDGGLYDHRIRALYDALKSLVDKPFNKVCGPDGYGDGHFVVPVWDSFGIPCSEKRRGWEGRSFYSLCAQPLSYRESGHAAYVAALYSAAHIRILHDYSARVKISHLSRDGELIFSRRRRTRTVLRRMFQPWN